MMAVAPPQQQPSGESWMDELWELHCGGPLAGAVQYTDAIVETMWELFQPVLGQLAVYSLSPPDPTISTSPSAPVVAVPYTDLFVLTLSEASPAVQQREMATSAANNTGYSGCHAVRFAGLSSAAHTTLREQPKLALALLEFFMAVWLYQQESALRRGGAASVAGAPSLPPTATLGLRHLYAAVRDDLGNIVPFDVLGAAQLGRLLTIRGTVIRISPARISCSVMSYRCSLCGAVKTQATEDGVLIYPGPCPGKRCRGYKWTTLAEQAICDEVQLLRLQEHTSFYDASAGDTAGGGGGGTHTMVEVELRPPWLDAITVGDTVCICGILDTRRSEGRNGAGMQQVCLRARSVVNLRTQTSVKPTAMAAATAAFGGVAIGALPHAAFPFVESTSGTTRQSSGQVHQATGGAHSVLTTAPIAAAAGGGAATGPGTEMWSPEEAGRLYEMARQPQWFRRLTASVAPSIYGMDLVKQAILLSIVGGNAEKHDSRSGIHVLMVGDPGLGKSQLLRAACAIAPRSAFVCAHTSSACGLTMTLTRDPVSGETTFEAGAVVHGDGGITCIDEIDKGGAEHKALLEVMEQESVSLAKAGMIFSMPVRTSLLAAGNPIGGRFDASKSLAANVSLSPALLSRFDIIVCLRSPHGGDSRNGGSSSSSSSNAQQALTDHVLQWHRRGAASTRTGDAAAPSPQMPSGTLPLPLVQRYLYFCRSQCRPGLCHDASEVLRQHYLAERERQTPGYQGSTDVGLKSRLVERCITPRYLQALIRVSEARAKLELRHEVTREDAEYAVAFLHSCLQSFDGMAAPGTAGIGGIPAASTLKKPAKLNQRDMVLQRLKQMIVEEQNGTNLFTEQCILDVCEEVGCRSAPAMMKQLNEYGYLLQKAASKYCLRNC